MERVGIWPGEKVFITSNASGGRLETYAIAGKGGSDEIKINL
jgi:aspartate 1-decarboxylase